jgi:hypothetical protein
MEGLGVTLHIPRKGLMNVPDELSHLSQLRVVRLLQSSSDPSFVVPTRFEARSQATKLCEARAHALCLWQVVWFE